MTIRPATLEEVPLLVAMGRRFRAESEYEGSLVDNPAQLATIAERLVTGPDSVMLVATADDVRLVGMIGLLVYTHHLDGVRTAGEVCWWVEPDARGVGLQLLEAGEAWAVGAGATRVQMIAPNARVGRLYERQGYSFVEMAYQKAVA